MDACKKVEQKYVAKLKLLQSQYQDLNIRETKLSQNRLDLSRERLELQSVRKKLYQSRCSLCKIGERSQELTELLTNENTGIKQLPNDMPNLDHEQLNYSNFNDNQIEDMLDREVAIEMSRMNLLTTEGGEFNDTNVGIDAVYTLSADEDPDFLLARFNAMNKSFME